MDAGQQQQQRIDALVAWARANNAVLHPAVEVYHDAQTGLSFRVGPQAASGPGPEEPVVSVPTALTLSYLNAADDTSASPFPRAFLDQMPPHVVGRFMLMKQFLLGDKSFWWPYIHLLPQPGEPDSWSLPPFWPSDDAELLEGTNVEMGAHLIKTTVLDEFTKAISILVNSAWDPSLLKKCTLELYQWAYSIFSSRSFRPSLVLAHDEKLSVKSDQFSVLVPLLDIGNHDMTAEVQWDVDESLKVLNLKVSKQYRPGEQIFNNYSLKSNAELLLGYGFMVPDTEALHNDYIHVRKRQAAASDPTAAQEHYISLRPINHPSSLLGRSKQTLHLSDPAKVLGVFSHVQLDMAWDIFCTIAPPERHADLIPVSSTGEAAEQERRDRFFSGQVSEEGKLFLQQTAAIIQHKVFQELERLDETDVEIFGDGDLTRCQKLALEYRARCRKVLENTLEAMESDGLFDE